LRQIDAGPSPRGSHRWLNVGLLAAAFSATLALEPFEHPKLGES
jgi:hypothetical protein